MFVHTTRVDGISTDTKKYETLAALAVAEAFVFALTIYIQCRYLLVKNVKGCEENVRKNLNRLHVKPNLTLE